MQDNCLRKLLHLHCQSKKEYFPQNVSNLHSGHSFFSWMCLIHVFQLDPMFLSPLALLNYEIINSFSQTCETLIQNRFNLCQFEIFSGICKKLVVLLPPNCYAMSVLIFPYNLKMLICPLMSSYSSRTFSSIMSKYPNHTGD